MVVFSVYRSSSVWSDAVFGESVLRHFMRSGVPRLRRAALPEINVNQVAPTAVPCVEPLMDDICMPPYFGDGWFIQNDFGVLARLLRYFDPKVVFEFGTAHGNTTANICKLIDGRVITLNALPEQLTGDVVTYSLPKDDIGRVYRKFGFEPRVTQLYENTMTFNPSEVLEPASIDFCIIDACHDMDFVVHDFLNIQPYITNCGVVILHDTHPSRAGHLAGSYDACVALRKKGYDILHIEDSWWGFWQKK